ncbi:MAG TPA: hypothetical protein VMB73_34625 [Acetobacteraceae bacterium]|jgi:hypothetical protein|nr:hypothetical protein [Acetobacteraceae bacterium]
MLLAPGTLRDLRTVALAVFVTLALGGCVAAPLMEVAASGSGNLGLGNMIRQAVPGLTGNATQPCAAGSVATSTGCSEGAHYAAATQATTDAAAADAQGPACGQDNPGTSGAGCGTAGTPSLLQNLTGSLQRLVPVSAFSH